MNLHDELKLFKNGYSKVLDHASREIRHGTITRNQGINLVKKYQNRKVLSKTIFAKWLNSNDKAIEFVSNNFRNKKFWNEIEPNKWKFNGISNYLKLNKNKKYKKYAFLVSDKSTLRKKNQDFITFGKGFNSYF